MIFKTNFQELSFRATLFSGHCRIFSGLFIILYFFILILPSNGIPSPITKWNGQSYSELVNIFTANTSMTTIDLNAGGGKAVEIINRHLKVIQEFISNQLGSRPDELKAFDLSCIEWNKYCEAECDLEYAHWAQGTIRTSMYLAMKFNIILERIINLKNRYAYEFAIRTESQWLVGKWRNMVQPYSIINIFKNDFIIEKGYFKLKNNKNSLKAFDDNLVLVNWHRDIFGTLKTILVIPAGGSGIKDAFEKVE